MRVEVRNEEAINWFKSNNIPIFKTRIYLSRPFKAKGIEEPEGIFLPRFYEGYIFAIDNFSEIIKRYVHESSHGSFFENFSVGRQISGLDRRVYEMERKLFGERSIEDVYVVTTSDLKTNSRKICLEEAKKLTRNKVRFEKNKDIFEVDKFEFDKYFKLSRQLSLIYSKLVPYLEGFALIITEELVGCDYSCLPLAEPYKSGYELLKPIKKRSGLNELIKGLYELRLNI